MAPVAPLKYKVFPLLESVQQVAHCLPAGAFESKGDNSPYQEQERQKTGKYKAFLLML